MFATLVPFVLASAIHAQSVETYRFLTLNRPIPDGRASGLSDVRTVTSRIPKIASVRVRLVVAGEFNGDLFACLRHANAAGTNECVLLNRPGRNAANPFGYDDEGMDVILDDAAAHGNIHNYRAIPNLPASGPLLGTWRPDGRTSDPRRVLESDPPTTSLASFAGASAGGEWTLSVADLDSGGANMLIGWELELTSLPPDHVAYVMMPLVIDTQVAHASRCPGPLIFGLGAGAPAGARVDPNTGTFVWTPSRQQAGSFNLISVTATDRQSRLTRVTSTFTVGVEDYAELGIGSAVVLVGQAGSVPVTLNTSAVLTKVQATIEVPADRMTNLALVRWAPEVGAARLWPLASNAWHLEFQAAPGQVFRRSQDLAHLSFLAVSNTSAFVPLVPDSISVVRDTGAGVWRTVSGAGRAAVVERQPRLATSPPVNGQPSLVLHGIPGHSYDILASPHPDAATGWLPVWRGTMPEDNLSIAVEGLTNRDTAPAIFFRAEDRFGQ